MNEKQDAFELEQSVEISRLETVNSELREALQKIQNAFNSGSPNPLWIDEIVNKAIARATKEAINDVTNS